MSVQNILNATNGKIATQYIDVDALGVVTNPLTASIDGTTAYGLVDANVVSTGTLQTDSIQAYSVLPGAPVAVTSNLKLQTPAKQIGFEDTAAGNTIYSLSSLDIQSAGDTVATVQSFFIKDKNNVADGIELHPFDAGSGTTTIRGLNDIKPLQIAQSSSSENTDRLRFDIGGSGTELKGSVLTLNGSSSLTAQSDSSLYVTAAAGVSITANGGQLAITAEGGQLALNANFGGNAGAGDIAIAGRTAFDFSGRQVATSDLNKIEQIASNNAYVPMTWYKNDISFTMEATPTVAFDGPDFIWRYSGFFGPAGLTSESAFCSSKRVQVDVNVAAEDLNDDVVWWVVLRDDSTATDYNARDFIDERFGFINLKKVNPSNGIKNQTFSFSTVFDLTSAGSPPDDGDTCKFRLFGYGNTTTTTTRAQVSLTVRPLREF
jgi:hypothetical protein